MPVLPQAWGFRTQPSGLEGTFTYDGLVLNDLSGPERYRVLKVDGLHSLPDMNVKEMLRPEEPGLGFMDVFAGGRTITFTGRIEAYTLSKMKQMIYDLRSAFNGLVEQALTIDSTFNDPVFINCRKSQKLVIVETQQKEAYFRDFMITLRASNPRILSSAEYTATIPFVAGVQSNLTVRNEGNFYALPKIRIGNNGSVTYPQVTGPSGVGTANSFGFYITPGTIGGVGTWWEYDAEWGTLVDQAGVKKMSTAFRLNTYVPMLSPRGGDNATWFTNASGVTGSPTAIITWRHSWL